MAKGYYGDGPKPFFDKSAERYKQRIRVKLPDGSFTVKTLSRKTKAELKRAVNRFNEETAAAARKRLTVKDLIEDYLEIYVRPNRRLSTYKNYRHRLSCLLPLIGDIPAAELTGRETQQALTTLAEKGGEHGQGFRAISVNIIRRLLKSVYNLAIENGDVSKNPVKSTTRMTEPESGKIALDTEQVRRLLETAKAGDYITCGVNYPNCVKRGIDTEYLIDCNYALVTLALATGMRIGELHGLRWSCVDFGAGTVTIDKQMVRGLHGDELAAPKTRQSIRTITVDQKTLDELKAFRSKQEMWAKTAGDLFNNKLKLVFVNSTGSPFNASNYRKRYFDKMVKAAGLPETFTFHCLRHTHASLLLAAGVPVNVVSKRLGHASDTVLLSVYAHTLLSQEHTAADAWAKLAQ